MRSVTVFPAIERDQTTALLDRALPDQRNPWTLRTLAGNLYIAIVDDRTGLLLSEWDADEMPAIEAIVGHRPTWAVQIDISGRIDGTAEVHWLVALLLERGGFATDDYSAHPWTLQEIESGVMIEGLRFFDFRAYHERHHGPYG